MTKEYAGGLCAAFFVLLTVFLCSVLSIGERGAFAIVFFGVLFPLALSLFLYRNYVRGGKIILRITVTIVWALAVGVWVGIGILVSALALDEIDAYLLIGVPIVCCFGITFSLIAEAATVLLLFPEKAKSDA